MIGTFWVSGRPPQSPAHFDPRQAFDHPVEQDDVGRGFGGAEQGLLAVGGMLDVEILALEMPGEQIGEGGIVLDQQQAAPSAWLASLSPSSAKLRIRSG